MKKIIKVLLGILITAIAGSSVACKHDTQADTLQQIKETGLSVICIEEIFHVISLNYGSLSEGSFILSLEKLPNDKAEYTLAYSVVPQEAIYDDKLNMGFVSYLDYVGINGENEEYVYPYVEGLSNGWYRGNEDIEEEALITYTIQSPFVDYKYFNYDIQNKDEIRIEYAYCNPLENGWRLGDFTAHDTYDIFKYSIAGERYYESQVLWLSETDMEDTVDMLQKEGNSFIIELADIIIQYNNLLEADYMALEEQINSSKDQSELDNILEQAFIKNTERFNEFKNNELLKNADYMQYVYKVADLIVKKHSYFKDKVDILTEVKDKGDIYQFNYLWADYLNRPVLMYISNYSSGVEKAYMVPTQTEAMSMADEDSAHGTIMMMPDEDITQIRFSTAARGSIALDIYEAYKSTLYDIDGDGVKELIQLVHTGQNAGREMYYICIRCQEELWEAGYRNKGEIFLPNYVEGMEEKYFTGSIDERLIAYPITDCVNGKAEAVIYYVDYICNQNIGVCGEFSLYAKEGLLYICNESLDTCGAFKVIKSENGYFSIVKTSTEFISVENMELIMDSTPPENASALPK